MLLRTLGGLELEHSDFGRLKPLLLLTYLLVEGPSERRHLAELFWPDNADALNSLSVALTRLRKGVPGAVEADEVRAWARLDSDLDALKAALEARDYAGAIALYRGPFLEGLYLPDWSAELEEWVYARREHVAGQVRQAYLALAEQEAARSRFDQAARLAEQAYGLRAAPALEPEDLLRLYPLLLAGNSLLLGEVRREAGDLGLRLEQRAEEARAQLRRVLVGRERELAVLRSLGPGQWAWVRGGSGIGKSALLRACSGRYLAGRPGLPYATLEPLLRGALGQDEEALLRRLAQDPGPVLLDGWERADPESRALLTRLRGLGRGPAVIVASREPPALEPDLLLELGPLTAEALRDFPGALEQTGGLPALVEAYLREEPLETALEARLAILSPVAREVFLTLALLDEPDLVLTRRALSLEAPRMAEALEELATAALIEPSGRLRVRRPVLDYLDGQPSLQAALSLRLARQRGGLEAFPLYRRSRLLWEAEDLPEVGQAYAAWARELLRRGFPQKAAEVLEEAPQGPGVRLLYARCLERTGRYQEALESLQALPEHPDLLALKGVLLWRLGRPEEAREAAEAALQGGTEARAEAHNTLGKVFLSNKQFDEALDRFNRAAALFYSLGDPVRRGGALNNAALTRLEMGEEAEQAFEEVLEASRDNLRLRAGAYLNLGLVFERQQAWGRAEDAYRQSITWAEEAGLLDVAVLAWNNLGSVLNKQARPEAALEAFERAMASARETGDLRNLALVLANISQLTGNPSALEEAVLLLEGAGDHDYAERFRRELRAVRAQSGAKVQS
ncbi:type IV pilus biogenesis/stability protein PilW [Calidithermus terrae]|uniref:Type IV pilus biogenesis/stability protein PilW n=1 Tax=Calidithermus terrae TaxID=1408545 RepID=A0A399DY14_9DEIN|nr:tetratricopeptide repeat protein [Calidithermus terrae]RIH77164.1 type IV pilus biogenesis/stability protein PilW [Calidithermus terrae]